MHITVDRAALLRTLIVTARIVEARSTIPILSNLWLGANAPHLTIRGTDLDMEASARCLAEVTEPGAVTVPARILKDIVSKLTDTAPIRIETGAKDGNLTLRSGRARFEIQTLPEEDFPSIAAGEMTHHFALPASDLLRLHDETFFAISTEETRYYLNGVYWHAPADLGRHEGLRCVATDGHRLARLSLPRPDGAEGMPGLILPRKLVAEIGKLAGSDGEVSFDVALSASKVRFTRGDTILTSKVIDGTFPDYQRVIPSSSDRHLSLAGREFAAALDRVCTVSSERGRAVKLAIGDGSVRLSQNNPDAGESSDEIDGTFAGAPIEIGFNGKYLLEALSILDADAVEFGMTESGNPALLNRKGDDRLLVVLMPMRV